MLDNNPFTTSVFDLNESTGANRKTKTTRRMELMNINLGFEQYLKIICENPKINQIDFINIDVMKG